MTTTLELSTVEAEALREVLTETAYPGCPGELAGTGRTFNASNLARLLFVEDDWDSDTPSDYATENSRHLDKYPEMHPGRDERLSALAAVAGRLGVAS